MQVCQKHALKVIKLFWSNNVESCFVRVGSSVQMDATFLRSALAITEQKKCYDLLASNFEPFQALCNNSQQHATLGVQTDATCKVTSKNVPFVCMGV